MDKPPMPEYITYPGPNAPTELQILAKFLMRWLESGDLTYNQLVEVYEAVEIGLEADK